MHKTILAAPLLLLACAPTNDASAPLSVDAAGAAEAAVSPPELTAVAQALDARRGSKLSEDLTILGARADGSRLAMSFRHEQPASAFGPAAREGFEIVAARDIRSQLCAAPATARFVETYGVTAQIVTADDAPLASVVVEDC